MKNNLKNMLILLLIVLIIWRRPVIITSIISAINIWLNSLFPSLFPFLIISDLIISTNLINQIMWLFSPIFNYLFKVSGYGAYVFIMSLISGCPSNAKYIKDLLDNQLIKEVEAIKILSMSLLYNPLFILTITSFLKPIHSWLIIIFNMIINLIIGLINRRVKCDYQTANFIPKKFNLVDTLNNTINTLLLILGALVLFIAISSLINIDHPLYSGIFEITNGLKKISDLNNDNLKLIFIAILLSFGGLSIHLQIKSILKDYKLDYSLFYKSRIIHLILFLLLIYLIT